MNIEAPVSTPEPSIQPIVTGQEASFQLSDLIYSRADPRGVIQFGNPVFAKISEFEWDELHNAPHKVLRHPDMPKAVFWLFWARLTEGLPVGAYIKNKTKSGKYYWVYALVHPCDGGYMSVRFKPTTDMLSKVKLLYAEVLKSEAKDHALSPQQSCDAMLGLLKGLGFPDYDTFMARSLSEEMQTRDTRLGRITVMQRTEIENLVALANEAEGLLTKMSLGFQNDD